MHLKGCLRGTKSVSLVYAKADWCINMLNTLRRVPQRRVKHCPAPCRGSLHRAIKMLASDKYSDSQSIQYIPIFGIMILWSILLPNMATLKKQATQQPNKTKPHTFTHLSNVLSWDPTGMWSKVLNQRQFHHPGTILNQFFWNACGAPSHSSLRCTSYHVFI